MRWVRRIALGLVALIAVAVIAVVVFVHTDRGRALERREIDAQLASLFTGGGSVGRIEGSPFGELVLRDLVIDGPDGNPAITVGTLRVRAHLFDLVRHDVALAELVADDVDVELGRDTLAHLMKARPPSPPSAWSVDLGRVAIRRAHVRFDTGAAAVGTVNLDDIAVDASAQLHANGARGAGVKLSATWRERAAPIAVAATVRDDAEHTAAPSLDVRIGGVGLAAHELLFVKASEHFGGTLQLTARRADVARLMPSVELPDDVAVALAATTDGAVALDGTLGATPITAKLNVDLAAQHVAGLIATGELDVAKLTHGKIAVHGGAVLDLDVARGRPGELPIAHATLHAHATYARLPRTDVAIALDAEGQHAAATVDVAGAATARLAAAVTRSGHALRLDRASLVAYVRDPSAATGGALHGAIDVALAAHGALAPSPSLAIAGSVRGRGVRAAGIGIGALELELDATSLPRRPRGTAHVHAYGLVRGGEPLGAVAIDATSRPDGWIDVAARALSPRALVELAARVEPPGAGTTTEIDVVRDRVRVGDGDEWTGSSGRIAIGPARVTVRDLKAASRAGRVAIDGAYERSGDLRATLDVSGVALATFGAGYAGVLGAHVAVTRAQGRLAAAAQVDGTGLVVPPIASPIELHAKLDAKPGRVAVTVTAAGAGTAASNAGVGSLDVQVAAPANLADVAAWRHAVLETATLRVDRVDLAKAAPSAHVAGRLDGELALTDHSATGALHLRDLRAPALQGVGGIDADLELAPSAPGELAPRAPGELAPPAPGELAPRLDVNAKLLGRATVQADVRVPARLLDVAGWRALGAGALRSASVRADRIAFDPGILKRLGVTSLLRGHASFDVELGPALSSVRATVTVPDLRGTPIATPVGIRVDAAIDAREATAALAMTSQHHAAMLGAQATIPISLARLRADPRAVLAAPLAATVTIPRTPAPQLLAVFGRDEVVAGSLGGQITVAGTVGKPTVRARITADGLRVPPGPGGKPIKEVKQLAIDARWDGHGGELRVDGTEASGGKLSIVARGSDLRSGTATITASAFDLVPVLAFAPGPAGGAAGRLDGNVTITGFDPRTAQIAGKLHVADARLPIAPEVGTLRDATVDVAIAQHDVKLSAAGKLGAGTMKLDGTVALDRASPTGGKATIVLAHVSPLGAIQPKVDAHVAVQLAREGERWTAKVTVDRGFVKVDATKGEKLKPVGAPPDLAFGGKPRPPKPGAPGAARPQAQQVALVATIVLKPTAVESDQVRTTIKGSLQVVAGDGGVSVTGSVDAVGGDVMLFDRRYRIEQAAARFDGSPDPLLDVRISYDFTDVTTITEVHGRASKPQLVLSSNPGIYTQSQLLGFLLGGEPGGDTQASSMADTATSAGESLVASQLGSYVKKAIPGIKIDVLKYQAASATSSEAVEAGTWVTHGLFFQFTEHPAARPDENNEEGSLEYWLTHRLELQLTAGDRNYDALDMLWRKRY